MYEWERTNSLSSISSGSINITLEDDRWKDSFDRILEGKTPLREKNIIKKNVRASFNLDSSIDETCNDIYEGNNKGNDENLKNSTKTINKRKKKIQRNKNLDCNVKSIKKNLYLQNKEDSNAQISTPLKKTVETKKSKPFNCTLSPIHGKWQFSYFVQKSSLAKQALTKNVNKINSRNNTVIGSLDHFSVINKNDYNLLKKNSLDKSNNIRITITNSEVLDMCQTEQKFIQTPNKEISDALIDNFPITLDQLSYESKRLSEPYESKLVESRKSLTAEPPKDLSNCYDNKEITKSPILKAQNAVASISISHQISTVPSIVEISSTTSNSSLDSQELNLLVPLDLKNLGETSLKTMKPICLHPSNEPQSTILIKGQSLEILMMTCTDDLISTNSLTKPPEQSSNLTNSKTFSHTCDEKTDKQSIDDNKKTKGLLGTKSLNPPKTCLTNVTRRKPKQINTFQTFTLDSIAEECIEESYHQPRTSFITKRRIARMKANQLKTDMPRKSSIPCNRSTRYKKTLSVIDLSKENEPLQAISFEKDKDVSNSELLLSSFPQSHQQTTVDATINLSKAMVNRSTNCLKNSYWIPAGKWKRTLSLSRRKTLNMIQHTLNGDKTFEHTRTLDQSLLPAHRCRTSVYIGSKKNKKYSLFSLKSKNPRTLVLQRCNQKEPTMFSETYSSKVLENCKKIGEGAYGEVFINHVKNENDVVLKVIPIEGNYEINGEPQKSFEEILSEIIISIELSNLRTGLQYSTSGFVKVNKVQCVKGTYPSHLIDLWELYRDNGTTENDHPEIFEENQLFIVLELENSGNDLEAFIFQNAEQSYSAFMQIACSLAVAEKKFQFEHRDLHWGNILLQMTKETEFVYKLNGQNFKLPTVGVKVTIIDYTLSRISIECNCLYSDLSKDDELFSAEGDYQFEIYRLMKSKLQNKWDHHEPYTNILWLHYIIDKMINGVRYRGLKTKKHKSFLQVLTDERSTILEFKSAYDYVEHLRNTKNMFNNKI